MFSIWRAVGSPSRGLPPELGHGPRARGSATARLDHRGGGRREERGEEGGEEEEKEEGKEEEEEGEEEERAA
eukprot:4859733-Pyramimonas_sp.AAC.1